MVKSTISKFDTSTSDLTIGKKGGLIYLFKRADQLTTLNHGCSLIYFAP